ncbi:hypothetical protein FBZ96_105658 [Bradyrhizobium stylosanthis]|uniref:Uncharacterized protein n=1 Tax=Bradyrhizobium stylosanthis TaxID=1803665 RepID=A0A560DPE5_9BRAD|nr:hypothetical protein FBZ96_105658 [Bradyrhizobium stylosanthis]
MVIVDAGQADLGRPQTSPWPNHRDCFSKPCRTSCKPAYGPPRPKHNRRGRSRWQRRWDLPCSLCSQQSRRRRGRYLCLRRRQHLHRVRRYAPSCWSASCNRSATCEEYGVSTAPRRLMDRTIAEDGSTVPTAECPPIWPPDQFHTVGRSFTSCSGSATLAITACDNRNCRATESRSPDRIKDCPTLLFAAGALNYRRTAHRRGRPDASARRVRPEDHRTVIDECCERSKPRAELNSQPLKAFFRGAPCRGADISTQTIC